MAGRNDFTIFYSNAQMVHEGRASDLYDFKAEQGFGRRVTDIPRPPNNHLPYELLAFMPLTYLRFGTAYTLWTILSMALLVGVAIIVQDAEPAERGFSLTLLTIFAFYPEWYCLIAGQDSILLLILFAVSFWLWKRESEAMAGLVLALGLFRPQLVLPFACVAFLAGKWKFIRGFLAGAVLVVALSAWVVGLHGMGDYARTLLAQGTEKSATVLADRWQIRPGLMPTWRGFLWVSLPTWVPSWVRTLLLLSGTAVGLGWAVKKMRVAKDSAAFDIAFAITVAMVLLVSFHSHLNDLGLMILPLLLWRAVLVTQIVPRSSAYLMGGICFLLFLTPLYLALFITERLGWLFLIQSVALWLVSRSETIAEEPLVAGQPPRATPIEIMQG